MRKATQVLAIILTLSFFAGILSACGGGTEKAIKDECERIMAGVYESSEEDWESYGFSYKHTKPKTTVDYDKDTKKFTCLVSVEQTITLKSDPSEVTKFDNSVTFYGHMNGDSVIIDNFKSN